MGTNESYGSYTKLQKEISVYFLNFMPRRNQGENNQWIMQVTTDISFGK